MKPGRLSPRSEFTPVPSNGSLFVYMTPPQNVMPARVTPVLVSGREFHSGNDHLIRCEIGLPVDRNG